MEVHIDLGNVSQIINENDIRSRIRNIRRFLTMCDARLNRLRVDLGSLKQNIHALIKMKMLSKKGHPKWGAAR